MSASLCPRAEQRCARSGRLFVCHNASSPPLSGAPNAQTCWRARTRRRKLRLNTHLAAPPSSHRFDLYQSPLSLPAPRTSRPVGGAAVEDGTRPQGLQRTGSERRSVSMLTGLSGMLVLLMKALVLELLEANTPFF